MINKGQSRICVFLVVLHLLAFSLQSQTIYSSVKSYGNSGQLANMRLVLKKKNTFIDYEVYLSTNKLLVGGSADFDVKISGDWEREGDIPDFHVKILKKEGDFRILKGDGGFHQEKRGFAGISIEHVMDFKFIPDKVDNAKIALLFIGNGITNSEIMRFAIHPSVEGFSNSSDCIASRINLKVGDHFDFTRIKNRLVFRSDFTNLGYSVVQTHYPEYRLLFNYLLQSNKILELNERLEGIVLDNHSGYWQSNCIIKLKKDFPLPLR